MKPAAADVKKSYNLDNLSRKFPHVIVKYFSKDGDGSAAPPLPHFVTKM